MSHSPESHETHQERPEPERIPFEGDPGEDLYTYHKVGNALDGYSWITTHQGPNGDFYTIKNAGIPEASMSIYNEKKRNAKLADAFTNGLYRYRENGSVFRPAPSDKNLPFIEATGLGEHEYGVSDKFKNKNLMDNETLNRIGSNGFISTGRGPRLTDTDGNTHNPNDQKGEIDKRSASIVLSYEARDKAISEGKTPEEAQEIGAEEYRRQEDFRVLSNESSDNRESNQTIIEPTEENKPSDGEKLEEIVVEDNPEENERNERRSEATKKWFRKIGHDTTLALKTVNGVGSVDTIHYGIHRVTDGLTPALEKTQKILEIIQRSPDNLSKEFRDAKDTIKLTVKLLKIIWEERQFEARKRKSIKYQEKLRLNSVDQVVVDARIAKIFVYLGKKHPETVLYSLYDSTPED